MTVKHAKHQTLEKSGTWESVMRGCGQVGKTGDQGRFREVDVCYNNDTEWV